jgi:hypothetical protein
VTANKPENKPKHHLAAILRASADALEAEPEPTPIVTAPPEVLDADGMAQRLAVSRDTFDLEVAAGRVPYLLVGSRRRYVVADVIAALAAPTPKPPARPAPIELVPGVERRARAR